MVKVQRNSPSILFIRLEGREGMEEREGCRGRGKREGNYIRTGSQ